MASPSPPHYSSVIGSTAPPTPDRYAPHAGDKSLQASNVSSYSVYSAYTLDTIPIAGPSRSRSPSPVSVLSTDTDRSPLLRDNAAPAPAYGAAESLFRSNVSSRKIMLNATIKMAVLFVISTIILGSTLWLALPPLEEQDRPTLRVPKSFDQLKDLNFLLKKYRDIYPIRIVVCYVTTYLFLQAFSLPGSMYLSILGGAVWGVPVALPLACTCVACGATLCYLISAALGPALLTIPKWAARLEKWSKTLSDQRSNLLSYLIVIRIAPFPPHWVVNVLAPHLKIGIIPFWVSTWLGILGVTVIHTTIGGGLDDMTSAADFHLISWRNGLGLSAVVVGVLIPVGLRFVLSRRVGAIALPEDDPEGEDNPSSGDQVLAQGPLSDGADRKGKAPAPLLVLLSDSEDEDLDDALDEEEDEIILASGPIIADSDSKGKEREHSLSEDKLVDI